MMSLRPHAEGVGANPWPVSYTHLEGDCVIEVTQSSGESRYDKIVSMIEQSEQLKSAAESHAANLADKLVPYTLIGSALSYALTRNVTRALSVLMVDFSCALKLAMPLAVLSAMREARDVYKRQRLWSPLHRMVYGRFRHWAAHF